MRSRPGARQHALRRAWQGRGPLAWALWPLALPTSALSRARQWCYQNGWLAVTRLPVPVVVVGNVVAGGAGKTPLLMALAQHVQASGLKAGVISRGYGRRSRGVLEVAPGHTAAEVGDEPLLIARRCALPVVVGENRPAAARALLTRHPQVQLLLSDDGLQHHALGRDVEVIVFDERGLGNGWLLPAGPLREPWPRQRQASAQLVAQHGASPGSAAAITGAHPLQRTLASHALRADGQRQRLDELAGQPLVALAGIAKPEAFFSALRAHGLTLLDTVALPDHYAFDSGWRNDYAGNQLICTEKDAVKIWPHDPGALAVPLEIDAAASFWVAFDQALQQAIAAKARPGG